MSYQKCPICDGLGEVPRRCLVSITTTVEILSEICPTCLGTRIINEDTGLPPGGEIQEESEELKENNSNVKIINLWPNGFLEDYKE